MALKYEVLFICDPSTDGTEECVLSIAKNKKYVKAVLLADRVGQAEAIRIGYQEAKGTAVITMDADFQDPPSLIPKMIRAWRDGNLIVHTKRIDRKSDNFFYRNFVNLGYLLLRNMTDNKIMPHVGDFRLVDHSIVAFLKKNNDPSPIWRAITNFSGVPTVVLPYKREARRSGSTKYNVNFGSPTLALRAIASFSIKPLQYLQILGLLSAFFAGSAVLVITYLTLTSHGFQRGIPTIIALLAIFFGIQFASTAIIATYLIILVQQTHNRPKHFIRNQKEHTD